MTSCPGWPPRSPYEALLSSPSGRNKVQQYHDRASPSPSPLKRSAATKLQEAIMDDDDDDEETLQLRLEALEARLKLKKLQQKKLKAQNKVVGKDHDSVSQPRRQNIISDQQSATSKPSADVQVFVSPQKRIATEEARSPGRVLLGIDKGLRGKNVSLRKPQTAQTKGFKDEDPFRNTQHLNISKNITPLHSSSIQQQEEVHRPKSFSQRIAETRQQDKERRERFNRLRKQRSTGFGIQQQDLDAFKAAATSLPESQDQRFSANAKTEYSRDEVLQAVSKPIGGLVRSNIISGAADTTKQQDFHNRSRPTVPQPSSKPLKSSADEIEAMLATNPTQTSISRPPSSTPLLTTDDPFLEEHSSIYLSKRLIPQSTLSLTFAHKHVSLLPSLLASIKSPAYVLPPELESDFIVLGVIASKSSPISHKDGHKSISTSDPSSLTEATDSAMNARGKYMVFTLTDLKWTLDLYLFTTAYTRFWKLTPGTLIAILNPSIMPPPPGKTDTGRFSLVLNSSDDTILEIGTARDMDWCKSVRKDGKKCESWVDKRHTQFCEWHVDRGVESMRKGRMEVNGMSAPYGPGGKKGGRTGFWGGKGKKEEKGNGLRPEGPQWDRATGSRYFIGPSLTGSARSAASLLDADGGAEARGGSKEERIRKRLAERERERQIARQLGHGGNGIGSEYLRLKGEAPKDGSTEHEHGRETAAAAAAAGATPAPGQTPCEPAAVDAKGLGLLGNKAADVLLSPIRKKRRRGTAEDGTAGGGRKKTRFATAGGVKVAGRESLGFVDGREGEGDEDEDEDELVIV